MRRESGEDEGSSVALLLGFRQQQEPPAWERVREQGWNPRDRRLFTPRAFGWGYDLNVHELFVRLGFIERP